MKDNKMVQSNDAFVKAEQAKMKKYMGNKPPIPKAMEEFDAYMSNDGAKAKSFAKKLTKGMDDCFPVN